MQALTNMSLVQFEEFFKIPTRIYRNIGRDPLNMSVRTMKEKVLLLIQCYIMFAYFSYLFIGQAWNAWDNFHSKDTLLIAFGATSCDGFCVAALLKEIVFAIQNKTMLDVTAELRALFPKDLEQQNAYKAKEYHKKTNFLLTSLVCACLGFTMGWAFYPIIKPAIKLAIWGPPFEKEFAFYIKYPYDQYGSNFNYVITTLGELIGGIMSGTLFLSVDLILSAIIYNCCMHMDYIARTIENYIPTGDNETDLAFLDPLIKLHIKILNLSESINNAFQVCILVNFFISTLLVCCIGFLMLLGGPEVVIKSVIFLGACLLQVWIICYIGQMLIDSSEGIAEAVYNQQWFTGSVPYRQQLLIIMMRAQDPATIRPPTFKPSSKELFMEFMGSTYRFFCVLKTMFGDTL